MNKIICALLSMVSIATANAQDGIDWVGGVAVGYTGLDFNAKLDSDPLFPAVVLTGSASFSDFYLTLSYADTLGKVTISEEEDIGDGNRSDLDLTFGYRLNPSWNIYIGYKDSETDIDYLLRDSTLVRNESYKRDGLIVGATYIINMNNMGNLSLNLGYVDLSTDNNFIADTEDDDDDEPPEEFDDLTGRQSGDATGISYGLSWLIPVTESLLFNTTFKINEYDEEIRFAGQNFKTDHSLSFFNVGILYLF